MRALIQRVREARVQVASETVGEIGRGLLVLLGVRTGDSAREAQLLANKVCNLRIFDDGNGVMNVNIKDAGGQLLVISQFTLLGDTRKGNRPSYARAASSSVAQPLYEAFVRYCADCGLFVATGRFGASMTVTLVNEGPVTLFCSTDNES